MNVRLSDRKLPLESTIVSDKARPLRVCTLNSDRHFLSPFFASSLNSFAGMSSSPLITLSTTDLQGILLFTSTLARKAGDLIIQGSQAIGSLGQGDGIDEKKNSVDLVTEYDVKVEELVKKELSEMYPGYKL